MPMHDWTRVSAGSYHNFHLLWIGQILTHLNKGLLPDGCYAMGEQRVDGPEPDVVTFRQAGSQNAAVGLLDAPPQTQLHVRSPESDAYAAKANRVSVYNSEDRVIAVLELVSPGNKDSTRAYKNFIGKLLEFIECSVHVLVVDPFPVWPTAPQTVFDALCTNLDLPTTPSNERHKPLQVVSVNANSRGGHELFAETFAVDESLPIMPLFLLPGEYINVPLEVSYQAAWNGLPPVLQQRVLASRAIQ